MEVRLEHQEKAPPPIVVTLGGMVIEARHEQSEKATPPIVVTLGGMVMETRLLHPLNAE